MVVKLVEPVEHEEIVHVREMYCQPKPPEPMVWDICNRLRFEAGKEPCIECARYYKDGDGDDVMNGCFLVAQTTCQYAMAWMERIEKGGPYE